MYIEKKGRKKMVVLVLAFRIKKKKKRSKIWSQ